MLLAHPALAAELALGNQTAGGMSPTATVGLFLYPGPSVAALQFDVLFEAGALGVVEVMAGENIQEAGKSLSSNLVAPGRLRILIAGLNQTAIAAGPVCFVVWSVGSSIDGVYPLALDDAVLASPAGQQVTATTSNGGVIVGPNPFHSVDTDLDFSLSPEEAARAVPLYTQGAHHCTDATHDGFAPGMGTLGCTPHSSDYAGGPDWHIDFSEMIRLIQLRNLERYRPLAGTEDGFTPDLTPALTGATTGGRQR